MLLPAELAATIPPLYAQETAPDAIARARLTLAAAASSADDFRRTFHGRDEAGRPWHVCIEVWP